MLPSPSADLPTVPRPYGLLGLILSLVAILALTAGIAFIMLIMGMFTLAMTRGISALDALGAQLRAAGPGSPFETILATGVYVAFIASVLALARFRGGREWNVLIAWREWHPQRHWKLFLALFLLTIGWEVGASAFIEHLHPELKNWIVAPTEKPWIIAFLAMVVLIGPIAEELVFRGWMYTSLRASFGLTVAVLVTSSLFCHRALGVDAPLRGCDLPRRSGARFRSRAYRQHYCLHRLSRALQRLRCGDSLRLAMIVDAARLLTAVRPAPRRKRGSAREESAQHRP